MKFKKEYLILVLVIAALGSYLVFHNTDNTSYELPQMKTVAGKEITRIAIEKSGETLELKKAGDDWTVGPEAYPADKSQVEPMLKNIETVQLTALVSEGENYHPYDLDPEHRIQVTAWAGTDEVRSISIGKAAPSFRHTFVKLPENPRVFHANDNIRGAFEKDTEALRDKTVLSIEKPGIARIDIRKGAQAKELVLTQPAPEVNVAEVKAEETASEAKPAETAPEAAKTPDPAWMTAGGEPADKADVEKLLNAVATLKCQSFIDGKTKADFAAPIYTLTLTGDQPHTLVIYAKPENGDAYPATSSGSDYPFNISTHTAEEIMKYLVEEPEAKAKPVEKK